MDIKFHGKRALVTGGGRGIGRVIAQSLVRCGAETFVFTKSEDSVEVLRREDPDITVIQVDMKDWENTRKSVQSILPLDLLVNNAGVDQPSSFLSYTEVGIDHVFGVNYKATFNISQIVAKDFIRRKVPGSIVNISSLASFKHGPNLSVYGSSKAAIDSLAKYMAFELGKEKIRVNAVNPTVISTDMTQSFLKIPEIKKHIIDKIPLGRLGEKQEVADVVLFLLSDRSSLVNGITMLVDGGHAL